MLGVRGLVLVQVLIAFVAASSPKYDESEAIRFVQYVRVAYCSKRAVESWSCGDMCEDTVAMPGQVRFLGPGENWRVQGYVARIQAGHCVVAFRGSVEKQNFYANRDFWMSFWPLSNSSLGNAPWCPKCRVHTGFARAYAELRLGMIDALRELNCSSAAFTGYSLGAAVATLASFEARATLDLRVGPVYTYGAPRVGNGNFARAYEAVSAACGSEPATWRLVHFHDPIPRIPPRRFFGYQHTSLEVFYDRGFNEYKVCEPVDGDENPACSLAARTRNLTNFDHFIYLKKKFLRTALPKTCLNADESAPLLGMPEEVIV